MWPHLGKIVGRTREVRLANTRKLAAVDAERRGSDNDSKSARNTKQTKHKKSSYSKSRDGQKTSGNKHHDQAVGQSRRTTQATML